MAKGHNLAVKVQAFVRAETIREILAYRDTVERLKK